MLYSETMMEHFNNPRNVGELADANAVGEVGNMKCGDIMRMYLKVNEETEVIEDISFKTYGCGAAVATSSMATEMVKGKTIDEALEGSNPAVADALDGLPPVKVHCSLLAEEAVAAAVADYLERKGIDPASRIDARKLERIASDDHDHHHGEDEEANASSCCAVDTIIDNMEQALDRAE